mmetsp:Transcript_10939/g.15750  ORF Transcript_10939/g.15750 Transcript_10939/m.15750 type:complete len:278 (+) Transcript_10939:178-1011(+)
MTDLSKICLFCQLLLSLLTKNSALTVESSAAKVQASDAWRNRGGFGKICDADRVLHQYLKESIPEALAHTGSAAFDDHLRGVQSVLRSWGSEDHVVTAGLFHSIYGTEGFQGYKLPMSRRPDIRKLIGEKAERLVWIFCCVDRFTVDQTLETDLREFTARDELGRFKIPLRDEEEWLDFIELTLADWLEQVEGAAQKDNVMYGWKKGEAFSYRREAYHSMAKLLAKKRAPRLSLALQMTIEVYAKEDRETKYLHQVRTPPMSQAAMEARDAIASIQL